MNILLVIAGIFIGMAIGWLWDMPYRMSQMDKWIHEAYRQQRRADTLLAWIRRTRGLGRPDLRL